MPSLDKFLLYDGEDIWSQGTSQIQMQGWKEHSCWCSNLTTYWALPMLCLEFLTQFSLAF